MMKTFPVIIISLLFQINLLTGQQNSWPYIDYTYARVFEYKSITEKYESVAITEDGKISPLLLAEGSMLTQDQMNQIIQLNNADIHGLLKPDSLRFMPNKAIIFFTADNKPVASVMFDFENEMLSLQPEKMIQFTTRGMLKKNPVARLVTFLEYRNIIEKCGSSFSSTCIENKKVKPAIKKLDMKGKNTIKQYFSDDDLRFDLSGMLVYHDKVMVIADKQWNKYIYIIDTLGSDFRSSVYQQLCFSGNLDIEGIECCNNEFYILDEYLNEVYIIKNGNCEMMKIDIPWSKYGIDRSDWGNRGFEGIAMDCENNILYLAKEREPRNIYRIDLNTKEITEPFATQLSEGDGHDIADMKFENGKLYILERGLGQITSIDLESGLKRSVSFQDLVFHNGERLFQNSNPQFGMAESFLLKPDEIWLGIDNNGDPVSNYGLSLGLKKGNKTIILIFKRPEGF